MTSTPTPPKERPILFSAPMVRALLEGRKTQTRRIAVVQPFLDTFGLWQVFYPWGEGGHGIYKTRAEMERELHNVALPRCPYGNPGDHLWVRENAYIAPPNFCSKQGCTTTDADGVPRLVTYAASMSPLGVEMTRGYGVKQTPSIHMPRWTSRLTLEVESIRLEPLHDITEADARAEGVMPDAETYKAMNHLRGQEAAQALPRHLRSARDHFAGLWDGINGSRAPWAKNPWVWVVGFKVLERKEGRV